MATKTKLVVLVEDVEKAIENLPNAANGYSDQYSKNRILHMLKTVPCQYAEVEVPEKSEVDDYDR